MKLFQQKLVITMALLAGLAVSTNTLATVIFYSTPFIVEDASSGPVVDSFSGTLSDVQFLELPRFDPALGTLEGVEIQVQSDYQIFIRERASDDVVEVGIIFIDVPHNDAGIDASVQGSLRVQLQDPFGIATPFNFPSANTFCYTSIAAPVSCNKELLGSPSTYDALLPLGALGLLDFVGSDPINLFTLLNGTFSGVCDGDDEGDECVLGVAISWSGLVGVTYTYGIDGGGDPPWGGGGGNTVPEPDSNLLIAIGLVLLALLRRRPVARAAYALTPVLQPHTRTDELT